MSSSQSLEITVNGEQRTVPAGTTVAGLLVELGFTDRPVAVERNRDVVPRAQHATTELGHGDSLEIVTFVGGG
jgi:sulfur carrier protein